MVVVTDRSPPARRLPRLIEPVCLSQMPPEAVAAMFLTWVFRARPDEPMVLGVSPDPVDSVRSPATILEDAFMPWIEPPV